MNVYEVLVAARAKIADPSHWVKGALAYDAIGQAVMADDKSACQFCSVGGAGVSSVFEPLDIRQRGSRRRRRTAQSNYGDVWHV